LTEILACTDSFLLESKKVIIAREREAGMPIGTEREVTVRRKSAQQEKGSLRMHWLRSSARSTAVTFW
jgi:hypothetical protein